jgi:hypothetical protein
MNQIGLTEMANQSPDPKIIFASVLASFQVRSSARLLPSSSPAVARLRLLLLTAPTPRKHEPPLIIAGYRLDGGFVFAGRAIDCGAAGA